MKRPDKRQRRLLAVMAVTVCCGLLLSVCGHQRVPGPDYEIQRQSAAQLQRCMDAVKGYKQELDIPLSDEDHFETGMLGEEFNFITTTIGAVEAKRTTANSDMAALAVRILRQAGVEKGSVVGCNFSGSFPALNLAMLCACDAMGARAVYIASCGASTYGANNPQLTFPEMACRLYQDGLISDEPALITLGGGDDIGGGMDDTLLGEIKTRVGQLDVPLMVQADFEKNVQARCALFADNRISCFVAVGGNITSMGQNGAVLSMGQGLLAAQHPKITPQSGLIEWYLDQETPVVLMLNIRQLVADYGLPYDPAVLPAQGTSAVYYVDRYPVGMIAATFAVLGGCAVYYAVCEKRKRCTS